MSMLIPVAKLVRDLLAIDEQLIRIGRQNFTREQFALGVVVIDSLGQHARTASLETYDGTTEVLSLGHIWKGAITIDLYGDGAYTRATSLAALLRSQASYELQTALGITLYQTKGLTDVKALTGHQYGPQIQLELTLEVSAAADIATLRIDTAQLEIRNEEGIQFNG